MRNARFAPFVLRSLAALSALAAAWGPALPVGQATTRVVLVDVSAGCDIDGVSLAGLADGISGGDALVLATFGDGVAAGRTGGAAAWRVRFASPGLPPDVPRAPSTATDVAAALRLAARQSAASGARGAGTGASLEVVVVGDGRSTSTAADLVAAAADLRRAGWSELTFVTAPRRELGSYVRGVRGPGRARRGEAFGILVEGVAVAPTRLRLLRDAITIATRDVPGRPFRIDFPDVAVSPGEHVYEARIEGAAAELDERPARAHVVVAEPGRALLLSDAGAGPALVTAIGAGVDRVPLAVADLAAELVTHEVVVVDGTPPPATQRVIAAWVRRGGGVLLFGGRRGVVRLGGPLAAAAPLRAAPPDDPGVFLYVALDGSGSMAQPFPGASATRDEIVRAAASAVLGERPPEVTVALRRFNDRLLPEGAAPWSGRPARDVDALHAALAALPPPAGGTMLAPVLREAAALAATRPERVRQALVFSDGRFADDPADVAAAARAVLAAGCRLTVVVDGAPGRDALIPALDSLDVDVVLVDDAAALARALRAAAARRGGEPLRDVALRVTESGRSVPGLATPALASAVARRWPASAAAVWVETVGGAPVAAVRRHGEGRVAALALGSADAAFFGDADAARACVAALRAFVERRSTTEVRVVRDGDVLLVRAAGEPPLQAEVPDGAAGTVRVALVPAPGGLLAAQLPPGATGGVVRLLGGGGADMLSAGLDQPAAPELLREAPLDTALLSRLAAGSAPPGGAPLRPWLAGLAVLALAAAHLVAARRRRPAL